jgi:heme O synthase-like polyprenyltransferase
MTHFLAITEGQITRILGPITNIIDVIVPALIGLVASVGAIWCIVLGVKFAKSEDPQEHEKAKKALINAIIGFVLIFVLLIMLDLGTEVFKEYWLEYDYEA